MFAQLCGETPKTNQCSFMKHSEISKMVKEHTKKIEGKAILRPSIIRLYGFQCSRKLINEQVFVDSLVKLV